MVAVLYVGLLYFYFISQTKPQISDISQRLLMLIDNKSSAVVRWATVWPQ